MHARLTLLSIIAVGCLLGSAANLLRADDAEEATRQIKIAVPGATAMAKEDLVKLATAEEMPSLLDFEDQNLTLILLSLPTSPADDPNQRTEFRYVTDGAVKPTAIVKEINRQVGLGKFAVTLAPLTMIHFNRIKDLTCKVDGDAARGTIKFEAPELYAGQVEYVARKQDDRWTIAEFHLSARDIHLARDKRGVWRKREAE